MCCWGTGYDQVSSSACRAQKRVSATFPGPLQEQEMLLAAELPPQPFLYVWMNPFFLLLYPVLHISRFCYLASLLTKRILHIFPFCIPFPHLMNRARAQMHPVGFSHSVAYPSAGHISAAPVHALQLQPNPFFSFMHLY